ncbi:MAG: hypothetical protein LBE82_01720 [Chitinophagaceae bacterium]|jgi:hypothetical protein|nr:hypothetical protein [Chitinophagaceae bacterium]
MIKIRNERVWSMHKITALARAARPRRHLTFAYLLVASAKEQHIQVVIVFSSLFMFRYYYSSSF